MPDHPPLLDLTELRDIYDGDALRPLLTRVGQHLDTDADAIRHAVAAGAYAECRKTTHRLKSMLMFISGDRLRSPFEQFEASLQRADADAVKHALALLDAQLGTFRAALSLVLDELGPDRGTG